MRKFPDCAAGRGTRMGSEASLTEETELRFWGFGTAEFMGQSREQTERESLEICRDSLPFQYSSEC